MTHEEALTKIKTWHLDDDKMEVLSVIIPELKESGNIEKRLEMRNNALMKCLQDSNAQIGVLIEENFKLREELKKQKELKPNPYSGTSFEYNGHIWGMCARDNGVDIMLDKQLFKHLDEKQGEQKSQGKPALDVWKDMRLEAYQQASGNRHEPNYSDDSTKMFSLTDIDEIFEKVAEKQDEQKQNPCEDCNHAMLNCSNFPCEEKKRYNDEQKPVESPKFKAGDIIKHNKANLIYKVFLVNSTGSYHVENVVTGGRIVLSYVEQNYHLWTIQDAKDGDVLAADNGLPFIYDKDRYNNGLAYYYAGLDANRDLTLKSPHHMLAHFGSLRDVIPATSEQRDLLFTKMREAGYEWDAEKKEVKKIEQKLVWGEEDKEMIDNIIDYMIPMPIFFESTKGKSGKEYTQEFIKNATNWLKSLKDRITITNKNDFDRGYDVGISAAKFNQWRPTEEQMEALSDAVKLYKSTHFDSHHYKIETLYEDLKKL